MLDCNVQLRATPMDVSKAIVASFNAQSVKGNDMACKRHEISTFIKDVVDIFLATETWLSAQGDEVKPASSSSSINQIRIEWIRREIIFTSIVIS